jgi:DNA-binding winged helix-turn-helix (wHTH) protein
MTAPEVGTGDVRSFGPFRLSARARALTREGIPVDLGARTVDLLVALASRPNEVIGKRDLLALVWPDVIVTEGSLRFHIASLRKALGDGEEGTRYIITVSGRGYCFVAAISRLQGEDSGDSAFAPSVLSNTRGRLPFANIPTQRSRLLGRADAVLALSSLLADSRFVTIVGAGGVGKATIAVAVGRELADAFAGVVLFVDLGTLRDPRLWPGPWLPSSGCRFIRMTLPPSSSPICATSASS